MSKSGSSIQYGQVEADRHLDQAPAQRRELVEPLEDEGAGGLEATAAGCSGRVEDVQRRDVAVLVGPLHVQEAGIDPGELAHALTPLLALGRCYGHAGRPRRPSHGRPGSAMHALMAYTKGLHELGDGCFAYLQPDGGWGWSNAGLVVGDGAVAARRHAVRPAASRPRCSTRWRRHTAAAPIATVVNTHANGDHCYGNQLVGGAEIVASTAAAEEMGEVPPALLAGLTQRRGRGRRAVPPVLRSRSTSTASTLTPADPHVRRPPRPRGRRPRRRADRGRAGAHPGRRPRPRRRRHGRCSPATSCSSAARPIVWAGPLSNWIAACDLILGLDVDTVVPGPRSRHRQGGRRPGARLPRLRRPTRPPPATRPAWTTWDAARDIALGPFGDWGESGRIAVNVEAVYRELDPDLPCAGHRRAVPPHGRAGALRSRR